MPGKPKAKASYREDVANVLAELLQDLPGVCAGKVFGGRPGFYVGTKLFAFVQREGVVLKLPEETIQRLLGQPGFARFQMQGRPPMKEWVEIRQEEAAAYRADRHLLREAAAFVAAPSPRTRATPR